ncbi:MAG TPA: O-antigen ligase family protein [Blastocatellia bacterium]|nr:O-antigen ligase family protein [Blastocatellia bacterium]
METAIRFEKTAGKNRMRGAHGFAFAGLFAFTLLLYARPNELFPEAFGTFPIIKIVAIATLLSYASSKLLHGEPLTIWPIEMKMLLAITVLGIIFIPVAVSPGESTDLLTDMFLKVVAIFTLMINLIDTRERLRSMLKLVVICGTVLSFFAIIDYLQGNHGLGQMGSEAGGRVTGIVGGIFENPNDLATSLDLLIPFAVALALTHKGLARAAYFACAAVLAMGVIITFSRGGFLGLVAMAGMLLWKVGRSNKAATALAIMIVVMVFLIAMPVGYSSRITSIFDTASDPTGSAQARKDLLERAASVAANHLVIGVGMGNYSIYSIHEQQAHNSFLEISAELGVAGLVAYLIMLFAPLRSLRRIEQESLAGLRRGRREIYFLVAAVQASLVAYIVCSCFGSIQYHWFLYYPLAYAIALRRICASEGGEPQTVEPRQRVRAVLWKKHQENRGLLIGDGKETRFGNR